MFDLQAKWNRPDFVACRGIFESKIVSEYFADIVSEWLPSRSGTGVF